MKQKDLNALFEQYCKAYSIDNERSRHIGEEYKVAAKGSQYLTQSDSRAGKMWAIMVNNGTGCVSVHYGYVTAERMAGYLEAMIQKADKSAQESLKVIQGIGWWQLRLQKTHLISILAHEVSQDQYEALEGIINLIDAIQEAAVQDGVADKNDVFNLSEDILAICADIYSAKGKSKVFEFCEKRGLPYTPCKECNTDTPEIDNTCCVCGGSKG